MSKPASKASRKRLDQMMSILLEEMKEFKPAPTCKQIEAAYGEPLTQDQVDAMHSALITLSDVLDCL